MVVVELLATIQNECVLVRCNAVLYGKWPTCMVGGQPGGYIAILALSRAQKPPALHAKRVGYCFGTRQGITRQHSIAAK